MARISLFPWPISWERGWRQAGKAVRSRCCASGRVCSSVPHYQSGRQRSCALQCHYSSSQAPGSRSLLTGCGAAGRPPSELRADWETDPPRAQGAQGSLRPWVVVRIQHFSHSYFSCTVCISQMQWRSSSSVVVEEKSRLPPSVGR